jgi:hypothetical protein
MALPNRQQFSNTRENFSNAVRGSRVDGRQLQAAPAAQQAVPQAVNQEGRLQQSPMLPPELQRIQAMILSYQLKLENDSFLRGIRQQQQQLQSAVQQRQGSYLNSIQQFFNTAPPELRQFLNSPQVMQNINMAYSNSQPEVRQIQDLNRQYTEYVQTNYGEEQKRLQELQQQASPQIQNYQNQMLLFNQQQQLRGPQGQTPPTIRNEYDYLPEGLTQEEFMRQSRGIMDQQYRTPEQMREYFKPLYDSYLEEKRRATAENKAVQSTPLPTQNPYTSTTAVDSTGTPITEFQTAQQQPTVKPITLTPERQEKIKTMVNPQYLDRTPVFKPPTPLNPIKQEPVKPIVDPKIEPVRPPIGLATQPIIKPEVDPIKTPTTTSGLGNKPKKRKSSSIRPSQYTDLNTSVKGLMNNGV